MIRGKNLLLEALRSVQSAAGAHPPSARGVAATLVERDLVETVLSTSEHWELLMRWAQQRWRSDSADKIERLLRAELKQAMETPSVDREPVGPLRTIDGMSSPPAEPFTPIASIALERIREAPHRRATAREDAAPAPSSGSGSALLDSMDSEAVGPSMSADDVKDATDADLHRLIVRRLPEMGEILLQMPRDERERIARSVIRGERGA